MRTLVRFLMSSQSTPHVGVLQGETIEVLKGSFEELLPVLMEREGELPMAGTSVSVGAVTLLAPTVPTKIICVGLNYRHHAEEMNKTIPEEPLLFLKPATALQNPGAAIELPSQSKVVHHEGEMAMVVGKTMRNVSEEEAHTYLLGLTCANDVTARDIQRREKRYTRAKGFDTFAPCGPWLVQGLDPDRLGVETRVNGEIRQRSNTDDMIFPTAKILSFVSSIMTVLPGDIILTGTPSGVGPLEAGDLVEVDIEGVGTLQNPVVRLH